MASSSRSVNVAFNISGADAGRQDVNKITTAFHGLGDEGKRVAQEFVGYFKNIEKSDDAATRKISDGRAVTEGDGKVMIQQFERLYAAVKRTFGTIANAPAEIQEAYHKAEQQFDRTTKKIQVASDAVDDQKEKLKEGGVAWTGLGDQINKALGPLGGTQVKILAIGAALKEGWELGHKFAQSIGTDFQAADSAADTFKTGIAGITKALT